MSEGRPGNKIGHALSIRASTLSSWLLSDMMDPRGPRRLSRPGPNIIGIGIVAGEVEVGPRIQYRQRIVVAAGNDRAASALVVVA